MANLTVLFPLMLLSILHIGLWLCWSALGNPSPMPPWGPDAGWFKLLDGLILFLLAAAIPLFFISIVVNLIYLAKVNQSPRRASVRVLLLLVVWIGSLVLLEVDPFGALEWWMD